jgi:hypothetical protein
MTTAWTTPGTWADGAIITHTFLNQQARDNLENMDQHSHSGAAGDGAQAIGSLTVVTFTSVGTAPTATGSLVRDGTVLKWHNGAQVVHISSTAGSGTPSLRAVGTGGLMAAGGTHIHLATAAGTRVGTSEATAGAISTAWGENAEITTGGGVATLISTSYTPGATNRTLVVSMGVVGNTRNPSTGTFEIERNGTVITSRVIFWPAGTGTTKQFNVMAIDEYLPATARTYALTGSVGSGYKIETLTPPISIGEVRTLPVP